MQKSGDLFKSGYHKSQKTERSTGEGRWKEEAAQIQYIDHKTNDTYMFGQWTNTRHFNEWNLMRPNVHTTKLQELMRLLNYLKFCQMWQLMCCLLSIAEKNNGGQRTGKYQVIFLATKRELLKNVQIIKKKC